MIDRIGCTVVDSKAIEFIAKKVASSSGDARRAIEMASLAIQHRMKDLPDPSPTSTVPLVKIPHVIQANKDTMANLQERINGQPAVGKIMLCVLISYAQAGVLECTVGELKNCVATCTAEIGSDDDMLQLDDFVVLLETLVDSGLLRATINGRQGGEFRLFGRSLPEIHKQPIQLGLQLSEVEKVLESELCQGFYKSIRESAKRERTCRD